MEKLFIVQQFINIISMVKLGFTIKNFEKSYLFFCFQFFFNEKSIIQPVALLQDGKSTGNQRMFVDFKIAIYFSKAS